MKKETHESITKLLRTFYSSKITTAKRKIITVVKKLLDALFREDVTDREFNIICESIFQNALDTIRNGSEEESPSNLVKHFKTFRRTKGDETVNFESAERLIKRAGSYHKAKEVITWYFMSDIPEFADKNSRPFYLHELLASYSLYEKYNNPKEAKRRELIQRYYGR